MVGVSLIVIIIASGPTADACDAEPCERYSRTAFEQAAARVLGADAKLQTELVTTDPDDDVSAARQGVDGVVELSVGPDGSEARVHCYLVKEKRWLDRQITFGPGRGSPRSEVLERGRLLGFAVATMFSVDTDAPPEAPPVAVPAPPPLATPAPEPREAREQPSRQRSEGVARAVEFAGIMSSGVNGTAGGLGASAGVRIGLAGPWWARGFIAGRTGNIPEAQASTRTALMGVGLGVSLLPESSLFTLGARLDALASYFDATHLSEDDIEPDRRSRWLAGADLVAEAGVRLTPGASMALGAGLEGMLGKTDVYTHGNRVAIVPPIRAIAELGFRTRF